MKTTVTRIREIEYHRQRLIKALGEMPKDDLPSRVGIRAVRRHLRALERSLPAMDDAE